MSRKKIFCVINITEGGINALFCRLGFHVWDKNVWDKNVPRWCMYCPKEKEI